MLSPSDIAPKCRAPSIWSFDSGYGSNTLEDDDIPQISPAEDTSSGLASRLMQRPIGLGLIIPWNANSQLRQPSPPVEPVTTRLNVFTTKDGASTDFFLPGSGSINESCSTCRVWSITWPEKNLKCDDCRNKTCLAPAALHTFDDQPSTKAKVPRLEIPSAPRLKRRSKFKAPTRCSACEIASLIDPGNPSRCVTCTPDSGLLSSLSPQQSFEVRRSCARRSAKLPTQALQHLQDWLRDNRNNPYPDTATKRYLAETCGITQKQVNTWFTNARARGLLGSLDRSHSGSGDEAGIESGFSGVRLAPQYDGNMSLSPVAYSRRQSNTTPNPAPASEQLSRRGKKKDYSHLSPTSPIDHEASPILPNLLSGSVSGADKPQETWQCTFCYQHIAPKSWRRHEETQHQPKRKWTCLRTGPSVIVPSRAGSTTKVCAFCMLPNPSEEHLRHSHRIVECMLKREEERTFLRPDHLRQHVKNFHNARLWDEVRDLWRSEGGRRKDELENWTCGFCGLVLGTWDKRETHVAGHFKDGKTMKEWNTGREEDVEEGIGMGRKRRVESERGRGNETQGNIFAKLARTLSGRARRQQQQQQDLSPKEAYTNEPPIPVASSSTSIPPLLPDTIFDSFMAEIYGENFVNTNHDHNHHNVTITNTTNNTTITNADAIQQHLATEHFPVPHERCDSAFPSDAGMDLDVELDLDALLNGDGAVGYQTFWE